MTPPKPKSCVVFNPLWSVNNKGLAAFTSPLKFHLKSKIPSDREFLSIKKLSTVSRRRPTFAKKLSWALRGLTAEFGMGSGVTPSLKAPRHCTQCNFISNNRIFQYQALLNAFVVRSTD
jgi:hypothetical protein